QSGGLEDLALQLGDELGESLEVARSQGWSGEAHQELAVVAVDQEPEPAQSGEGSSGWGVAASGGAESVGAGEVRVRPGDLGFGAELGCEGSPDQPRAWSDDRKPSQAAPGAVGCLAVWVDGRVGPGIKGEDVEFVHGRVAFHQGEGLWLPAALGASAAAP